MDNKIKTLNILFTATWISLIVSVILSAILSFFVDKDNLAMGMAALAPIITYIVGRILCFKEYDE